MPTINITQWSTPVNCRRGSILDAALSSGVPYPHSCRSGECGSCKTLVLKGEVDHDPYDPSVLSDSERDAGLVLACRARPKTDVKVAWLSDVDAASALPVRRLKASVRSVEQVTHDIVRLRLGLGGKSLAFAAGQYARLCFTGLPPRPYSMANRPDEDELEFHIRRVPQGLVSRHVNSVLRVGDAIRVEGPFGDSYLREGHDGPIVLVAGGSGLAPVRSILRTAIQRMSVRPVHVYLGVRDECDVYGEEELVEFAASCPNIRTHIVLSEPTDFTARRTGFVHEALAADIPDLSGAKIYAAGPPPMVNGVVSMSLAHGASRDDVHSDPFTPSGNIQPQPEPRFWQTIFPRWIGKKFDTPAESRQKAGPTFS